jgi:hypothetical protein
MTSTISETPETSADTAVMDRPWLADWAVPARFVPGSSNQIGNDDTGTYRDDTEEADT